ncbi:HpcH/HpaI aldolase family protein [Parafrigoribacterium humi]|jgi:2-keto-3-deoxy-L-rhamnonate aldolase RhmA|uniref:HpcH/HpaI aldolase family protein n=1 Tax=Parafrigoribacterium humi TaxID=3144664 RepID=UPI0032ECC94D
MERHSLFRAAVARTDKPALGIWVKIPAMEIVELIAIAGFDFIVIDLEHSPLDLETAYRHIGTALHLGVSPIVRVPGIEGGWMQRILDAGAEGIMLPHVDTPEQAEEAVRAIRFEPWGVRGVGATSRAGAWGSLPREEYLRFGQDEVVFMPQIESGEGARNAAAIAAVKGVDALFIGTNDMSANVGKPESSPEMKQLVAGTIAAAHAAGVPVGNPGGATAEAVRSTLDQGYTFTVMANDATMFGTAAAAAVKAGRSVGKH